MSNIRGLKMRVRSLESTRQITKSMKMVAASKLRRSQMAYMRLKGFSQRCKQVLEEAVQCAGADASPLLQTHKENKSVCYVLFIGNRGLCGQYNNSLLRYLTELLEQEHRRCSLVVCGRWGADRIAQLPCRILRRFEEISDTPDALEALELSDYLAGLYSDGAADEVVLVYQKYNSVLQQSPGTMSLLPLKPVEGKAQREYIFEPDKKQVLDALVKQYVNNSVFAALLEARTGENAARMSAMTAAADNATELISKLQLKMNHMRQAAITTEIAEIAGGSAALDDCGI